MKATTERYAIIDVETTGGRPGRDRITEIAIALVEDGEIVDEFTSLVNPERAIPYEITRLTGIDNDMVKSAPRFFEVAKRIVEITEGAVFVAHNVRFDFGFVAHEFRRLGYTFTRKQLCTVRLTRKIFPGLKSYSLGNLCKHFGLTHTAAHRAWSDVEVTVQLFQKLLAGKTEDAPLRLQSEIATSKLPRKLDPLKVDELPDTPGVYYFLDEDGKPLYVGKSTQIRKRVLSHFSAAHKTKRGLQMMERIADIDTVETGSELIALLHENSEIKKYQPTFNRAQLKRYFKVGVFSHTDTNGFIRLKIQKLELVEDEPIAAFPEQGVAEGALRRKAEEFGLCLHRCGLVTCRGSSACLYEQLQLCQGVNEEIESYNRRVEDALTGLLFGEASFVVVGKGRNEEEHSLVAVVNNQYVGFGYIDRDLVNYKDRASMLDHIQSYPEQPGVRRIIQQYVKTHPKEVFGL
ncbi:MAG: exonuclease domain-containing protein [Bacteroidia bacterium]